jgi:hypothetical protein
MQKVFLFLVLLIVILPFSSAKSENNYKVIPENSDSALRKLHSLKEPYSIENFEKYFNDSINKYGIKDKSNSIDMSKYKNYLGKTDRPIDNMPVIIPRGRFQMPVAKPDSSVKYFMLIKKPDNVKR